MMADAGFRLGDGDAAEGMVDELGDLYEDAYAEPPYDGGALFSRARFLERTRRQCLNLGFSIVTRREDTVLTGFAFGFPFEAGRWWAGVTQPTPPRELVDQPTFAVIELVVGRPWRSRGIARRLLETLLARRPEPYAVLLAEPAAPARRMYDRWGWEHVADVRPAADAPALHALVRPL
jgi:GNAT superfamily N-acetyltransferase